MSSLATVDSIMIATVGCEAATRSEISSSAGASKPKQAFADAPPLARLRKESKSCECDSSEAAVETTGETGPAFESEPQRLDVSSPSQARETPVENQSADIQVDPAVDLQASVVTEGLVFQGDAMVAMPAQGQVSDAQSDGATSVCSVAIAPDSQTMQNLPAAVGEAMPTPVESEALLNTEISVPETPTNQVEVPGLTESRPLGVPETSTPVQSDEVLGLPPKESIASVVTPAESDQSTPSTGAQGAMAGTQAAEAGGSGTGDVPQNEVVAPARANTEVAEVVQTPAGQQGNDDSASHADLGEGRPRESVAGMTPQDSTATVSQDEPVGSQEVRASQLEGQMQVVASKEAKQSGSFAGAEAGSKPQSEMPLDAQSSSPVVSDSTSVQTGGVSDAQAAASVKNPVQNVGEQILDSVQASVARGDKQVLVRLDPPELGSVTVRFQEQNGEIIGVLEVSKDQTRQEVEQTLPEVLRGLQEAGVQVRRMDVVLADQSERDLGRESLAQDAWAQQQGSEQQDARPGHSSAGRWSTWMGSQQDTVEPVGTGQSPTGVGQGRIDMLI